MSYAKQFLMHMVFPLVTRLCSLSSYSLTLFAILLYPLIPVVEVIAIALSQLFVISSPALAYLLSTCINSNTIESFFNSTYISQHI